MNNYGDISANTAALVAGEKFTNSADGNIYSNELNIIASKNYNYGNIQASKIMGCSYKQIFKIKT